MKGLRRSILPAAMLALLAVAAGAGAATTADEARLRERLAAAQRRLDAASREVAALSVQLGERDPLVRDALRVGTPARGELGIRIEDVGDRRAVRVASLDPAGPAAVAGIGIGDVIVAIDGPVMGGGRDVQDYLRGLPPGRRVRLDLQRNGRPESLYVVLRAAGDVLAVAGQPAAPGPSGPTYVEGFGALQFVTLTPRLGRYFGADRGVLVVQASADNVLRLEEGDVLQAIDGRAPRDGPQAFAILLSYRPGERATLEVLRDRRLLRIEVGFGGDEGPAGAQRRWRTPSTAPSAPEQGAGRDD